MRTALPKAVHIRPALWDDIPALVRIEQESFSDPWSEDAFSTALSLDRMHVWVAEDGTGEGRDGAPELLGYVVALVVDPEAEIADLAVAPAARRRGVGRALLEWATGELRTLGVDTLYLEVRESNRAARALYETNGFRSVGRRRGYYRQPVEDALLLRREIGAT